MSTVQVVEQKAGATGDAPPNQPVPETVVTAVDGQVVDDQGAKSTDVNKAISAFSAKSAKVKKSVSLAQRTNSAYEQVFAGTGTQSTDRDGSIEGTAYLTYTVVSNATYNVDACLDFCSRVDGCGMFEMLASPLVTDKFSD